MRLFISALLLIFFGLSGTPETHRPCSRIEERKALGEYEKLHTWIDVYRSFKRYSHCDDGAVAEGYSDKIAKLLAKDWEHFSDLNRLANSDHAFRAFVLRHIDATTDPDDLREAHQNAQKLCPVRAKNLCKAITDATEKALDDM